MSRVLFICEVADNICYQESIRNNLFAIYSTPKSRLNERWDINVTCVLLSLLHTRVSNTHLCAQMISVCRDCIKLHKIRTKGNIQDNLVLIYLFEFITLRKWKRTLFWWCSKFIYAIQILDYTETETTWKFEVPQTE